MTLSIVVCCVCLLQACGGESDGAADAPSVQNAADKEMVVRAAATAATTVPGTWAGRVPPATFKSIPQNLRSYSIESRVVTSELFGRTVSGEHVVSLKSESDLPVLKQFCTVNGCNIVALGTIAQKSVTIAFPPSMSQTELDQQKQWLRNQPWVSYVTPQVLAKDAVAFGPTDPSWKDPQKHWNLDSINLQQARDLADYHLSGPKVNVAVIDSNFNQDHSDLSFLQVDSYKGTGGTWHGTAVAGIIGAKNNSIGMAGIAAELNLYGLDGAVEPGAKQASFTTDSIMPALERAVLNKARVVNLSLASKVCDTDAKGDPTKCEVFPPAFKRGSAPTNTEVISTLMPFYNAIVNAEAQEASLLMVQSSGNLGHAEWGHPNSAGGKVSSEFSLFLNGIGLANNYTAAQAKIIEKVASSSIIVGAYRIDGTTGKKIPSDYTATPRYFEGGADLHRASFILAPGGGRTDSEIYTTIGPKGDSYSASFNGTSAAAPHVAGVAALILGINPKFSAPEVREIILSTADNSVGSSYEKFPNAGDTYRYLNAEAAVRKAIESKECGTISNLSIAGLTPPYTLKTGLPYSFTTKPTEKAEYPFTDFTWNDGTNSYTWPYPSFVIKFDSPGTHTVTVTPVVGGTVCLAASQQLTLAVETRTLTAPNGKSYEVADCGNWYDCKEYARQNGGQLATIRSGAENDWIVANMLPKAASEWGLWIGFNDRLKDGFWNWDSGEPVSYTNWSSWYNPNPNTEDAAHMVKKWGGTWNDTPAYDLGGSIKQGLIEYITGNVNDRIYVNVQNYKPSSLNIAADSTIACRTGLVYNAPPYSSRPNVGEWDVYIPADGLYRVSIHYSAELSRPVVASIDGVPLNANALGGVNGTWCSSPLIVEPVGDRQLDRGTHTLRLERTDVFPHLARIVFSRIQ